MSDKNKLPCPWCGSIDVGLTTQTTDREGKPVMMLCVDCGAVGPWEYEQDSRQYESHALKLWNRRIK